MLKVLQYLKKSLVSVFLIIILLIIQAYLDLTLPEYTSKIINVGVQQNGIENAVITKISKTSLDKLFLFATENEEEIILENYTCKTDDICYLNDKVTTTNKDKINTIFSKLMTVVTYIDTGYLSKTESFKNMPNDPKQIYAYLASMDQESKTAYLEKINEQLSKVPESITTQVAVTYIKSEYKELGIDISSLQTNYIIKVGLIMLLIALGIMLDGICVTLIGSRMAAKMAKELRERVFSKVIAFSKNEMKNFGVASLITRTTNDIQQVQMIVVFLLRVVFYAPIIAVGGVIKAHSTNAGMTNIIGFGIGAIIVVMLALFVIAMPKFNIIQKLVDKLNLVTREILTGLPVIRAFSNEHHEEARFAEANKKLTDTDLFISKTMSFMMPIMMLIMNLITLALVYKGAISVDNGSMQVGDILAYIQYTMQIIMAFLMISSMSIMLPRANVSAKRIMEVIETDIIVKETKNPEKFIKDERGKVVFKNVSFRYPDADYDVLTNITLTAEPGKTTAFIGSTGSGKSTLINLLPRFYDATKGEITVDGVNIKNADIKELRAKIGFVPQKGILFTGTIKENIRYGNKKVTDKDIEEALKIAQASDFVSKLENGLNYQISQGGTNVSGGQKQRLAIARAIAKNPDIYVFDDSFSALDFKTDAALRKELAHVTKDKTVLIVAQRISTIMHADQIVVLNEGNIVGIGTHKELLEKCQVYREIAESQLSKEELQNA